MVDVERREGSFWVLGYVGLVVILVTVVGFWGI